MFCLVCLEVQWKMLKQLSAVIYFYHVYMLMQVMMLREQMAATDDMFASNCREVLCKNLLSLL